MLRLLTPLEIRRGMRLSIVDGMLAQAFYGVTWPGSVFLTGFALFIGANAFEIGLMAALGPILSAFYLPAAWLLEKAGRRKPYYIVVAAIHRFVFFALLAIPFFAAQMSGPTQRGLLIAVVFFSVFFGVFNNVAWMSWMADMIPESVRGSFFGRRNLLCGALWMGMSYLLGLYVDAHQTALTYAILFAGATFLALVALVPAGMQPEPPLVVSQRRPSIGSLWRDICASIGFRNFLLFQLVWGFTTSLAGPFYNVYMLQSLHVDIATITAWGIVSGIVATVTQPYWGALGDRAGNRSTLLFALIGSCFTAFGWLLVSPENLSWMMIVIFALSGFFDSGVGFISFNMLLGVLPEKNKPSYLAVYEAVVGTVIGFSPMIGGYLAVAIPGMHLPVAVVSPVLAVIGLSTVLRLIPIVFVKAMPTQRGRNVGFVMREFVLANPFRLFTNLYFTRKSAERKVDAIDELSHMKSKAAVPDLILSIRDLDPRVRRQAVRALGEIGDPYAFDALLSALDDPLEDIQGEAALALGSLRDRRAAPALLSKLRGADEHLQSCAATALGGIGASEAVDDLIRIMQTTARNSVRLACADALGHIGRYRSVEPLLAETRKTEYEKVKHSLVAGAALLIDHGGEIYRAISHPDMHLAADAHEILSARTVRLARESADATLRGALAKAMRAFAESKYNDAVVEMKTVNQITVREFLSSKPVRGALRFEDWVRLLDSSVAVQMDAVQRIDPPTGIALAIVDYYARHCPSPSEPDMDKQEFLLALHAFRAAQEGLGRLTPGNGAAGEKLLERIGNLRQAPDVV